MIPQNGLCVGLDLDRQKLPAQYRGQPNDLQRFACDVIDAVRPWATCFKINVAFYEQYGRTGIDTLYAVREHCGDSYVILDAKRGDIGNTSAAYAQAAFFDLRADAVTVAPYMGRDSVEPFLAHAGKMVYVLGLTSNPGSQDFQRRQVEGIPLYELVMRTALSWERQADIGFVVGATSPSELAALRGMFPDVPFLIPGIGTQGGDAGATLLANGTGPAVYNVSRGLLYIDDSADCLASIADEARRLSDVLTSR
jgi:orotidine-5'-phosphate decarboxylase